MYLVLDCERICVGKGVYMILGREIMNIVWIWFGLVGIVVLMLVLMFVYVIDLMIV